MRQNVLREWFVAGMLAALQSYPAPAQNGPTGTPAPPNSAIPQPISSASEKPVTPNAGPSETSGLDAKSPAQYSAGVNDVLKMVQAGISKDVVKAYIETAQVASPLTPADIVALKEHGVPDDLTVALLKRGAGLNGPGASNAAPAQVSGTVNLAALVAALRSGQLSPGYLDPEGYDYFRYYYLYPRTLASANRRLWSSYPFPVYPGYSFGLWSPWAVRPRPFAP